MTPCHNRGMYILHRVRRDIYNDKGIVPIHARFSSFLHKTNKTFWYIFKMLLTLNVSGDYGSSRPTRVEPRLHCVDIAWQVRGRCVGSAAHSPLHAIAARALSAARAIEPRSMHFARVRELCSPITWRPMHWYPLPCNFQPIQFAIQANHAQYYLKPIPFLPHGENQNHLHIMPQICQSSNISKLCEI